MYTYLRFTSIATLLIGLQLFSPKMLQTKAELGIPNSNASNYSYIASNSHISQELALGEATSSEDFTPPDNGHPNNTRGSGTR
jgi:hypothetical protein